MEPREGVRVARLVSRLVAVLVLLAPARAAADDGGMSMEGGAPRLMQEHPQIEMTSEFVHAWIAGDSARVECVFFMHNRGDSTTALMGFPDEGSGPDGAGAPTPFRSFASFVDGRPVWTRMVEDSDFRSPEDYRMWYLKSVPFAAHQTRCIRDIYVGGLGFSVCDDGDFSYELQTGRSWAGPIGTAEVVFTLESVDPDTEAVVAYPPATSHHGHEWRWHFDDIEPGTDGPARGPASVSVAWHPRRKNPPCE